MTRDATRVVRLLGTRIAEAVRHPDFAPEARSSCRLSLSRGLNGIDKEIAVQQQTQRRARRSTRPWLNDKR
jgi:hypothetical protein